MYVSKPVNLLMGWDFTAPGCSRWIRSQSGSTHPCPDPVKWTGYYLSENEHGGVAFACDGHELGLASLRLVGQSDEWERQRRIKAALRQNEEPWPGFREQHSATRN